MSHALLLRLFLSPFFSVHVALQYLKLYPANIGITHYLTGRLRRMPSREVEFYWPELCHLLVTQPTESIALEAFVLERAEESTHSAMLTFWFMQAALCDLAPARQTVPRPFIVCQRILLRCHEIIFGDPPPPSRTRATGGGGGKGPITGSPYPSATNLLQSFKGAFGGGGEKRIPLVPGHIGAALVGMGVVLAATKGAPARPLIESAGHVALAQGRMEIDGVEVSRGKVELDTSAIKGADGPRPGDVPDSTADEEGANSSTSEGEMSDPEDVELWTGTSNGFVIDLSHGDDERRRALNHAAASASNPLFSSSTAPPSTSSSPTTSMSHRKSPRTPRDRALDPSATAPSLLPAPIAPHLLRQNTTDPLDQLSSPSPTSSSRARSPLPHQSHHPHHPRVSATAKSAAVALSRSVPSLSHSHAHVSSSGPELRMSHDSAVTMRSPDALLDLYSPQDQTRLLRSHYCRSEVRFLIALEDISNRLLVIPKPARVSALRAELTSLNHMLPAEVCMPTWCGADHAHEEGGETAEGSTLSKRPDAVASSSNGKAASPKPRAHHRVVRISPGDAVVLNSAERAPYLVHVEVLEGDLDFDPSKRANRDLLRKIVSGEEKRKGGFGGSGNGSNGFASSTVGGGGPTVGFGGPMPDPLHPLVGIHSGLHPASTPATREVPRPPQPPEPYIFLHPRSGSSSSGPASSGSNTTVGEQPVVPEEEMDLVEQLYGDKVSARDIDPDLETRPAVDRAPRNRDIDRAVWSREPGVSGLSRQSSLNGGGRSTPPLPRSAVGGGTWGTDVGNPSDGASLAPYAGDGGASSPGLSGGTDGGLTLDDYSDRMRTAAVMLAQLAASSSPAQVINPSPVNAAHSGGATAGGNAPGHSSSSSVSGKLSWLPGTGWIASTFPTPALSSPQPSSSTPSTPPPTAVAPSPRAMSLLPAEAEAIRERIMKEMLALEEERVERMMEKDGGLAGGGRSSMLSDRGRAMEDEGIVRRELNKADPSAAVFSESWTAKKARIRAASPWGHLATWDVLSVIVKTGADLRQEQLATQLIERFARIWKEENCSCWVRYFRILITGDSSGLVETITDSVSVHSIKKAEYGRRLARGASIVHVSLLDHFINVYGEQTSARFIRAQRNFIKSLAGYAVATYLLQIKDRHNGNILIDRDGHCVHIDFGFMLSNSPGNMGFEAAPFKLTMEYVDIMGGLNSEGFLLFKKLFREGFEAARKHSDEIITIVELMQYNSKLDCFKAFGDQTAQHLRERFQLGLTQQAVNDHLERLIVNSIGSRWTQLYDSFQWYSQGVFM